MNETNNIVEQLNSNEFLGNSYSNIIWAAIIIGIWILFYNLFTKGFKFISGRFLKTIKYQHVSEEFDRLLKKPIRLFTFLIFLFFAISQLSLPQSWTYGEKVLHYGNIIYQIILIISVTIIVVRTMDLLAFIAISKSKEDGNANAADFQAPVFFKELLKLFIYVIALLIILGGVFNLNISSVVAGLGIGGVAIALAAQDSLSNLLGSFIIFLDKPFKAGDVISIDNITGTIEHVGLRSTRIRTVDKSLLTVPNKKLTDTPLNNITLSPFRRVNFTIGLTYDTKSEKIKSVIEEIKKELIENEGTTDDFNVVFMGFGASSLDIMVIYYVLTNEYSELVKVREEINFKIMEIVESNGCEFAYPTQTLYLKKEN